MNDPSETPEERLFDDETWAELPAMLGHLPERVSITMWGDANASHGELHSAQLCRVLADEFDALDFHVEPRRENYPYYPVLGFMGLEGVDEKDYGVRIIGHPAGIQFTSLIAAIQAVAFRGVTIEPLNRARLVALKEDVTLEVMTSTTDEEGTIMAKTVFGLAVNSDRIRSLLIMTDYFPGANLRFPAHSVPHTIINGRVHVQGVVDEETLLKRIASAVNPQQEGRQ